ncbi:MAG: sigma-70 family RNA polymerase sigma factor [Prevotella sp.]|nr:sigma-70 family RNA polymerase sigma factor [Prevotella sp.]MBR4925711.1 sigma-70 family RNA polymerase sigma factor [Prevotella sp.]
MEKPDNTYRYIAEYYSMHRDELCAFAAKRLKYAYEAEDIVHNVFLKLLTIDKMITPVTLPCLVYTMTRNLIYDNWRRHKSVDEYEHVLTTADRTDHLDASSVYSASELNQLLERGIARLSERQREVYRMNVIDGMKVSEISMTLNIGYKSTEHRLGEARKEVRGFLARMLA